MNISQALANKGRFGDTMVAHLSPREAMMLKAMGGAGTRNPKTGLPEFFNNADFLASFGTGEGGYEEFLNALNTSVPDTSVATTTPSVVTTPTNVVDSIFGGWYSSPEGGNRDVSQTYTYTPPPTEKVPAPTPVTTVAVPDQVAPSFNPQAYVAANPQAAAYADPFAHYITQGKDQGLGWGTGDASSPTYNPQKKYEYQPSEDQTWAVPGLKEEKPGDQLYTGSPETGDMSMYQRDETGKPTTSNYKYFSSGDDLYGAGVSKVYQDPTKYYTDMPDVDKYQLTTDEQGNMYYTDEAGNKYSITDNKVTVGGKTYSVTKGDETKYSTKIATTADLTNPDYSGKYQDLGTVNTQSEWQDVQNGYGWKYRYVNGQIYYAMPGDDITKTGYTGLTQDQVTNAYTYKGKNYSNMNQDAYTNEYGTYDPGTYENSAWAYDEATGNYYRPVFTGHDVMMTRMLRPGEDSGDSGGLLNIAKYVLPTVVNTAMSMGMGSSIIGELAAAAAQTGSMAGSSYLAGAGGGGAGLGASAGTAAVPTFTEGIKSGLSSIGDYLASIPSSISSGLSNLSWSSLAPSSLKAVAIPAAVGAGYSGMQSDWDLMEMLKGAGMGALGGYGVDRLLAGLKYLGDTATVGGDYGPGTFSDGGASFEGVDSWTANHPSELLANQGLDKYGMPVSNVSYDPTLIEPNIVKSWEAYNANKNMIDQGFDLGELPNRGLVRLDNGGDNSYLLPERSISDPSTFISEHDSEILRNLGVERTPSIYYDQELLDKSLVPEIDIDNPMTWRSEHDVELLANQGMNSAGHIVSMFPFDPTLIDPETYALWEEYTRGDLMTDWLSNPFETIWNTGVYPSPYETLWNIDWDQYNGGPIGFEPSPWDYISSAGSTIAEIAPSILKILGTVGTTGTGGTTETGGTESTEFPSGSGSASGGYGYTTTDTSSSEGTGGAGRESALAKAKAIAALQAIKDSVNKKFSGQLYYT